jgi:hypothetical protein
MPGNPFDQFDQQSDSKAPVADKGKSFLELMKAHQGAEANPFDQFSGAGANPADQGSNAGANPFDQFSNAGDISTITGERIPTPEEKMSMGKDVARTMGAVAGGTALSMLAPQLAVGEAAPLLSRLGLGALNLAIRSGAAGAGAGGGDIAGQLVTTPNEPIDYTNAGRQAVAGAAGEALGSALVGGGRLLGKGALKFGRAVGEFTGTGQKIANRVANITNMARREFEEKTTGRALNFVEGMKAGEGKLRTGLKAGEAIASKENYGQIYKKYNDLIDKAARQNNNELLLEDLSQRLWDHADNLANAVPQRGRMLTPSQQSSPGQVVSKVGSKREAARLASTLSPSRKISKVIDDLGVSGKDATVLRQFMERGYTNGSDAKFFLARLFKRYGSDSAATQKLKEELKSAMLDDIGNLSMSGAAAQEAKQQADTIYAATKQWFRDNPTAQYITRKMNFGSGQYYENYPERALDRILNAQPDEAARIMNEIRKAPGGQEIAAGAEFEFIRNMYDQSIKTTRDTGAKRILPRELADRIYENKDYIQKVFPGIWNKLKAEADYMVQAAPQFEKMNPGDVYSSASAWDTLSPKTADNVRTLLRGARRTTKALSRTATSAAALMTEDQH